MSPYVDERRDSLPAQRGKAMSWIRLVGLIGLTLSLVACGLYFSRLQFINGIEAPIRDLTVTDGQKTWRLGDLDPGEDATFSGHLSGEGGGAISWIWDGKRHWAEGCYHTVGSQAEGSITIVGDSLRYRCQ